MNIPSAPARGRRVGGVPSARPQVPTGKAVVGKRLAIDAPAPKEGVPVDGVPDGAKVYDLGRGGVYRTARDLSRAKRAGKLAAAAAVAGAGVHLAGRRQLQAHPERRPSAGRMAAGTLLGPYHAAVAGRPGQKLKAVAPYAPLAVAGGVATHHLQKPHRAAMQNSFAEAQGAALNGEHARMGRLMREGFGHAGAGTRAALPITAATLASYAGVTRYNASRGRYKEQPMSKRQDASPGRYATGMLFGGVHGLVAGKPGHKLGAGALQTVPTLLAAPLTAVGVKTGSSALHLAAAATKYGGRAAAVNANQKAGNLKRQDLRKSMTCLPTNTRIVVARTPGGRYASHASHANDLVHLTLAPGRKRIVGSGTQAPVHVRKANLMAVLRASTKPVTGRSGSELTTSPRVKQALARATSRAMRAEPPAELPDPGLAARQTARDLSSTVRRSRVNTRFGAGSTQGRRLG